MAQIETGNEQEGSDELKQFLLNHKNKLKNAVEPIYQLLKNEDIDHEELMEFAEVDLRKILNENDKIKLKSTQIGRLINILRSTPESTIYKTSKKEKVVIILSDEEHNALNSMKDKSVMIKQYKQNITDTISELNKNKVESKKEIDKQTKLMIEAVQKRQKELTIKLDNIIKDKTMKLTKQLINLQNDETKINECYTKCKAMVDDTTLDSIKRKSKILTNTKSLLSDKNIALYNEFKVVESADIVTKIDIKDVMNAVRICGEIKGDNKPFAPIITIKELNVSSVKLNIKTDEDDITGYRLKYGECNDDNKEDMDDIKTDFKNIEVNESNNNISYKIESLKPSTNYVLHGYCKNIHGFGTQSKPLMFKTKKRTLTFVFDVCTEGKNNMIQNNGKTFNTKNTNIIGYVSAGSSVGSKSGICEIKLKVVSHLAFGITTDVQNCKTIKFIYHYEKGKSYYAKREGTAYDSTEKDPRFKYTAWKNGDTIKMKWDSGGTLTFYCNNSKIGEMNITAGLSYYPCVCTSKANQEYELVSSKV